jgi:hypothetical protein
MLSNLVTQLRRIQQFPTYGGAIELGRSHVRSMAIGGK